MSERFEHFAHLPGHSLALADFGMSAFRLGHGPHLLPYLIFFPGKDGL